MQLEHELALTGDIGRKKSVAGFYAREMKIGRRRLPDRGRYMSILQQCDRTNVLSFSPALVPTARKNRVALRNNPEKLAGRNRGDKKEMNAIAGEI
jgi:hypothetical protein